MKQAVAIVPFVLLLACTTQPEPVALVTSAPAPSFTISAEPFPSTTPTLTPMPEASTWTPPPYEQTAAAVIATSYAGFRQTSTAIALYTITPLPPTSTRTPTVISTRTLTPTPTLTSTPRDPQYINLNSEEERMLKDGLGHLRNCAPLLYNYVRSHVKTVTRGEPPPELAGAIAFVKRGYDNGIVYLPTQGSLNDPRTFKDSMRTFVAAAMFVHEARHIEKGMNTTEQDAYRFELQVFTPACKPNDISNLPYTQYQVFKEYVESRSR